MSAYSVADAKSGLPRLIDRALEGEEVIITRHGKPVAELRPLAKTATALPSKSYDWLQARRADRKPVAVNAVDLLNQMYENPNG